MGKQWTLGDSARRRAAERRRERATTMKAKPDPVKYRLYAKPAPGHVPKWWPRVKYAGRARGPAWVGVQEGGTGWNVGPGDALTFYELREARTNVEIPGPKRGRRFRTVPVVEASA
jgi:hypothetical protein